MRKKLKWRINKAELGEEERNLVGQLAIFKYIFSLIPSGTMRRIYKAHCKHGR
jgi:hypothetical protein